MWKAWRAKRLIKYWRKTLSLDKHHLMFNTLYSEVNGFSLSKQARTKTDAIEWTYGEIEFESFIALLSLCEPNSDTIFYDLGSGTGKAVLACAMVFPVNQCYGVELLSNLHACAQKQKIALSNLSEYKSIAKKITFQQEDMLNSTLSQATIIFINASAFFGDFWKQLSFLLEQVQPNTLVISTSKPLKSTQFIVKNTTVVSMSWGVVNAYIQQKISLQSIDNIE